MGASGRRTPPKDGTESIDEVRWWMLRREEEEKFIENYNNKSKCIFNLLNGLKSSLIILESILSFIDQPT